MEQFIEYLTNKLEKYNQIPHGHIFIISFLINIDFEG